jgi:3-oxoadipate enol-lactonase
MRQIPKLSSKLAGKAGAPVVTFIPGIGNDSQFWADQAARLMDRYRVLTFDPWGSGDSPPPATDCRFADVVDGVIQLLDAYDIGQAALVGLGFGGSVALAAALDHPERISKVIACCCRPRQPDDRRAFWRDRQARAAEIGIDRLADITVDRWLSEAFRAARPDADLALRQMFKRMSVESYQAYVGAFIDMDFTAQLGDMQVPTMLVAAENDHGGGPPNDMRAMAAAIPNARFELIRGAGHIVNYEVPDALAACVADFLDRELLMSGQM